MNKIKLSLGIGTCCLLTAAGCAHTPPKELVDARTAYKHAEGSIAREENAAQLDAAEKSLTVAEREFEEEGDSQHTRDLSYVAMRQAQVAEMQAHASANEKRLVMMEQQRLAAEQQARLDAERRAEQAAAELARIATVTQELRGMVIMLSGQVLFGSGKSELLPSAQTKLTEVANALKQGNPDATIVVEGHTDSHGSKVLNLELSQRRAQAVRDYLAAQGIAPERIRAEGMGFARPVANNKTAVGRANNRRVEIVVQPAIGPVPGQQG